MFMEPGSQRTLKLRRSQVEERRSTNSANLNSFPWFKDASVSAIQNVRLVNEHYLYWPDLDVDLAVESIEEPERFPLVAK
jgi:hypothetical protein